MKKKILLIFMVILLTNSYSQVVEKISISVELIAKHNSNCVWLRWAPTSPISWQIGNTSGWIVERALMPSKIDTGDTIYRRITSTPLMPLPVEQWRSVSDTNKYAAIAAQMLYGETINLLPNNDAKIIIDKNNETDTRYSFSLTAAEQDFKVSEMMGLGLIDKDLIHGRIYVYRIYPNISDSSFNSDTTGVVVNLNENCELPKIYDLKAEVTDSSVYLNWPVNTNRGFYSSYVIEKRTSNQDFKSLNDLPYVSLGNRDDKNMLNHYTDCHPIEGDTIYYRIRGKTPFGEKGPTSNEVEVVIPFIFPSPSGIKYFALNENRISIEWEFPDEYIYKINSFRISTNQTYNSKPRILGEYSSKTKESIVNIQENEFYLTVSAIAHDKTIQSSYPILVQFADSIPPKAPKGLNGIIKQNGEIFITWQRNDEIDIFGYRLYASAIKDTEFNLISKDFICDTSYSWVFPLNSLSRFLYFKLLAYDHRYNFSEFSEVLKLTIPDTIPPSAPILKECNKNGDNIRFQWIPSSSKDIFNHTLIIKSTFDHRYDTIFSTNDINETSFTWSNTLEGEWLFYIVAKDSSGNTEYSKQYFKHLIKDNYQGITPELRSIANYNEGFIELNFGFPKESDVILIYRSMNDGKPRLYKTIQAINKFYNDKNVEIGNKYTYFIQYRSKTGELSNYSVNINIAL